MQKATQENNVISIDTPLGKDVLYLTRFAAEESMSHPFSYQVMMFTVGTKIALKDLVGKKVCISLRNAEGSGDMRYFHGVVSHLESLGMRTSDSEVAQDYIDYRAVVVPSVSLMVKRSNCRIYQNLSVQEIVADLFGQHQVDFSDKTTKTYPKYDYCVQYHESDFDFISRLLQQEGIFYFFDHSDSEHTLVLADDITAYKKCAEDKVRCFSGHLAQPHIGHWQGGLGMVSGGYAQKGYDFEQPELFPAGNKLDASLPSQQNYEVYEYLGESEFNKRPQPSANVRLEALQKDMHQAVGQGDCRSFAVGKFFTFADHEDARYKGKSYLLTRMRVNATQPNQSGANQSSAIAVYSNDFDCVPKDTPYRPSLKFTKPVISGVQTAVVTGDAGDEQHIDKYGRVKVQFHWDREGKFNGESSCWIRVAQNWAGNKWGAFFFPRVGQEVLVDFINGDPDQPIISGAVYNADLMPPYALPAKKTQSGIKSHSTKQGGVDNFNEVRFEDDKGKELLFFQAEKDHELKVKNDQKDSIGNNRITEVVSDNNLKVGKNRLSEIGEDDTLHVGKVLNIEAGSEIIFKTGSASITMNSGGSIEIKGTDVKVNGTVITLKAAQIKLN
ncbi:type VI secretion system tip protein TssI/VgrG [Thalassomonas actiniarum]|uniref:Type VI secretion system tip protein VgrG n=1 Tax=Thalassomonas actiniarum TaxID=485447 RepID=A0AAE9YU75_9GAMM|nr:type VI secretion system tip protein TssI/VgrG [Thalassomonas actiniarum]WDE01191.1 type VI secretion system tip protein VgrG [Thalassomonas actiniarum]